MQSFFGKTGALPLFFIVFGSCLATSSHGMEKSMKQMYLGSVLQEIAADLGYNLTLDCKQCMEFPVSTVVKNGTMHERLEKVLGGIDYVLEHKEKKEIVVHILSDISPKSIIGTGNNDYSESKFQDTSIIHSNGEDFQISTTTDGIQEIVSIQKPIEEDDQTISMEGPDGLEEKVQFSDNLSTSTQDHGLSGTAPERVTKTDEDFQVSTTSDGFQEIVNIRRSNEDAELEGGQWVSMDGPDGLDEKIWESNK